MYRLRSLVAVTVFLSACSSAPQQPAAAPAPPPGPATVKAEPPAPVETEAQRQVRVINQLSAQRIYFGSDSSSIKSEYQDLIREVYEFLKSAPQVSVTLVGHTDKRGGANRALALKRAESVKRALKQLGLPEDRLQAIRQVKQKPGIACHEEKCRAQDRRVDLVFHGADTPK